MTKILIVEDDAGLRQALEINLRLENYEPVTAADGEEAIDRFHSDDPDLVLLDLMIPKKSGFEVLDHIRKHAVLRRSEAPLPTVMEDELIKLDPNTREAEANGQKLKLSPKEFDLLMYLFKNKERVVPRDELLSRVWNYRVDLNLNSRTVDTHVTRLRRKLQKAVETSDDIIIGVAKVGYRYMGVESEG
jgi:DNA-binding response OmpR family regulator